MQRLIFKTETARGAIVCLAAYDLATGSMHSFGGPGQGSIDDGLKWLSTADELISHSPYHFNIIKKHLDLSAIIQTDTALLAQRRHGNPKNSFDVWAYRLDYDRPAVVLEDRWTADHEFRCVSDIRLLILPLYRLCLGL